MRTLSVVVLAAVVPACGPHPDAAAPEAFGLSRLGATTDETFAFDPWVDDRASAPPIAVDVDGDGWDDLVGSESVWSGPESGEGAVAVWFGGPGGLPDAPDVITEGGAAGVALGVTAFVGDTDGDGVPEILSSDLSADGAFVDEGRVELRPIDRSGIGAATWTATGGADHGYFGAPALGFDANGDGYADLAVSTVHLGNGGARVWYGGPGGLGVAPDWTVTGSNPYAESGYALAAGDLDGDGFDDLVVSAPRQLENNVSDAGRVWWFRGGPLGLAARPAWSVWGTEVGQELGTAIRVLPDLDGDGYAELGVSSPYAGGASYTGTVEVYRGGPTGPGATPTWTFPGEYGQRLGRTLAVGDPNGDGRPDLLLGVLGSWVRDQRVEGDGGIAVVLGVPGGLSPAPAHVLRCLAGSTCDTVAVLDREHDGADELFLGGYLYQEDRVLTVVAGGSDRDEDGSIDVQDCAPDDPDTHPGADEVWYDDVDEDCRGGDDWDRDHDGVRAVPRGPDGDDGSTRVRLHLAVGGSCTSTLDVAVWGATPGGRLRVFHGAPGGDSVGDGVRCAGTPVDVVRPSSDVLAPLHVGPNGRVRVSGVPSVPGVCGGVFQVLDVATCTLSEAVPAPP